MPRVPALGRIVLFSLPGHNVRGVSDLRPAMIVGVHSLTEVVLHVFTGWSTTGPKQAVRGMKTGQWRWPKRTYEEVAEKAEVLRTGPSLRAAAQAYEAREKIGPKEPLDVPLYEPNSPDEALAALISHAQRVMDSAPTLPPSQGSDLAFSIANAVLRYGVTRA